MKNITIFHRSEKEEKYSVISNSLITSKTLSPEEKTILFHILSLPNDWKLYKSNLEKYYSGNITKGKFNAAWKGLIEKGYLLGTKVKNEKGKYNSWKYEVFETPITDIPKSDVSVIGVVENTTSHNLGHIQSTNKLNTNLQSTNSLKNKNNILGSTDKLKNKLTEKEIQLNLNHQYFNNIFSNTGIDWENEISSMSFENFIQKYTAQSSETGDDFNLRFNLNNYYKLTGLENPQPPPRE